MDSPRDHFGSKGWLGVADMTTPAVGDKMLMQHPAGHQNLQHQSTQGLQPKGSLASASEMDTNV